MRKLLITATGLLAVSVNAYGADNGIYLGGALSRSSIDTDESFFGFDFEDEDTAYKFIAGIRPFDAFAIEANYVDFGNISFDNRDSVPNGVRSEFEAQALDAFAVGFLGGPLLEVFGKVGVVYWDADSLLEDGISASELRDNDSGTDLAYGGGLQARFGSLGARLEYEKFEVADADKVDLWSLGLTYTFF